MAAISRVSPVVACLLCTLAFGTLVDGLSNEITEAILRNGYNSLGGPQWDDGILSGGWHDLDDHDFCEWQGIFCRGGAIRSMYVLKHSPS